ncbi:hypothetical protein [uncultured Desulfuromonas sp.]|uniref:hypothetical protein n=1 Tax=uncultured Desulfuromonas sp. TaxID=181013 RepID=UPI002AABFD37|nr:hypothetical protein [uncultured Desulfuromonas sp.]
MRTLLRTLTLLSIGLLWTVSAWASLTEQLKQDFSPVDGYVVMAAGAEYIIDVDSSQGVSSGDLFSVITPGEKIIHPVTGEVIGSLDTTSAVLQVTRIKTGYSYAKIVRGEATLNPGTAIHRFDGLDAVYLDETGTNRDLLSQIKEAVPSLQWQGNGASSQADLYFQATGGTMQVRDAQGQLLRSYALSSAVAATPVSAPQVIAPKAVATPVVAPAVVNTGAVQYQAQQPVSSFSTSGLTMEFPRFNKIGQFGSTTRTADFEAFSGKYLLAAASAGKIRIFDVSNGLTALADGDSATMGQILSVSWWQPTDSDLYLVVNVWGDDRLESDLLKWTGNGFAVIEKGMRNLLAAFDTNGNGRSETLLAQDFSRETFYGNRVREAFLSGAELDYRDVTYDLPQNFRIIGALIADVTGDQQPEISFIRNRRLYIYSGDTQIYKSNKEIGASISGVTYDIDPAAQNPMITTAVCEVAPVAADLDGDGVKEIVAIGAEGTLLQAAGVTSSVDQSWLAVFKYQDGMLLKGTLGDKLERPIQGVAVVNGRALMVATELGSLLGDGQAASYVLSVPVN